VLDAVLSFIGAERANASREQIAADANAFSAQQYANRYQTTVKDIQAAGLNPMLAYSQGAGSAPTGQQAQGIENSVATATEAHNRATQRNLATAQIANVGADTQLKQNQAKLALVQAEAAASQERLNTTNANESTYRLWSQQNVQNPTQKALAASYWSQVQVNSANLPKIAQEIKTGGAYAAQAYASAAKAHAERRISEQEWFVVKNAADYAKKTGLLDNSLKSVSTATGAVRDLVPGGVRRAPVRETGTYYDRFGNPTGGYSRQRN
jgi:hypothetical protein